MFYNEYVRLCIATNTTPTGAAKAMGLAGAHVNKWKNGSVPTDTTLVKVARHFNLPDNYFDNFKKAKEKSSTPEGVELDAETIQLKEIWDSADQEEREALLAMAKMLKARRNK